MAESEMERRVALNIWHARARHFGEAPKPFVKDERWELCLSYARAAIEAMREPTEGMLRPGSPPYRFYPSEFRELWQAMIDAALSPPPARIER